MLKYYQADKYIWSKVNENHLNFLLNVVVNMFKFYNKDGKATSVGIHLMPCLVIFIIFS